MEDDIVTLRLIKKILNNKDLKGYNDLRTYGHRIKLKTLLSVNDGMWLQAQLDRIFPHFQIEVRSIVWRKYLSGRGLTVTAIYVKEFRC